MKIFMIVWAMMSSISLCACSPDKEEVTPLPPIGQPGGGNGAGGTEIPETPSKTTNRMKITIGGASFAATLEDNQTAKAFKATLPMTVKMNDMNRNEKYYYLASDLPTAPSNPGTIRNGDIMLYGSDCLVLFYKTFSTSYSYTRIGRVSDDSGFEAALGKGEVSVKIELINE